MNKQPEITDMTRGAFVKVFCNYYKTRPIEKISVKEISAKAGYSRATFYNYFTDVYELLEYVENEFISYMVDRIQRNVGENVDFEKFIQAFVETLYEKEEYINVFMNSSNRSSFINQMKLKMVPLLLSVFNASQDNTRARYALEFYVSGLIPVLGSWLKNGRDLPADELADLIRGILQEGILEQIRFEGEIE